MGLGRLVALSLVALVVGTFVGATGVGGLVLPPALIYAGGMAAHTATATSSWAFLLTGVAGTVTYARRGSLSVHTAAWLGAGATPGAALGAWCNGLLPGSAISAA
ncbi:MAG: sulfite exporter TauE/SafE family protein, partial [Candidatus Dormibacteraeota bacterium]|nr:sulfite exporter TauE/SafE family protein [Candidatus Dormibacteraeota bacterium]